MTSDAVWVFGAGGHAKVVIDALEQAGVVVAGVLDRDPERHGCLVAGYSVRAPFDTSDLESLGVRRGVLAFGDNRARLAEAMRLGTRVRWCVVRHPRATIAASARLAAGVVVMAGAVVQAEARVGAHAIVNTSASVDHDSVVGQGAHVGPGCRVAGGVSVGEGAVLGAGAVILPGMTIGAWSVVGAGAIVVRDVPDVATVYGNPARERTRPRESDAEG